MGAKTFLNFDLALERAGENYRANVAQSPGGQATLELVRPFSPEELQTVFSQLSRNNAAAARAFGKKLYDAVFADEIKIAYLSSAGIAASQNAGLRVRLRLNETPELAYAPWEILHDGQDFLAFSPQFTLVRYLELRQPLKSFAAQAALRVLFILSSPRDDEPLDLAREWARLQDALADAVSAGLVEIELLEHASLTNLQEQLGKAQYHILHFSGHGMFDARAAADAPQGKLVFVNEDGRRQVVDALELGRLLKAHDSLRLVVLNACEGARADTGNVFAGAAQTLIEKAVPAVIAMQFPITDEAAQTFSRALYGAFADSFESGFQLETALSRARLAMQRSGLEWATPVLFSRQDENLFTLPALGDAQKRALKRAALFRQAHAAVEAENFARALDYAQRVNQLDPTDANAQQLLQRVQIARDLALLYAEGKRLYDAGQLAQALEYLRRIQGQRLNYRDTDALVSLAERVAPKTIPVAAPKNDPLETHYAGVIKAFINGRLVPFLGIGVNLVGRPQDAAWSPGQYPPSNQELSAYLAQNYHFPSDANMENLVGVSQYIAVLNSDETLKSELRAVFDADYPPTRLHRFLATATSQLREKGYKVPCPIIISTMYDDILERTLRAANEPFDLVTYIADGDARGNWWHRTFEGQDILIDKPNQYVNMKPDQRIVVVKIHGAVDRDDSVRDSFVITEDHYIDYLTSSDISSLIPVKLKERLQLSSFLFMGYALRDWNLRVLLYRIWGNVPVRNKSWAIQPLPEMLDREIWQKRNVSLIDIELEQYLDALETRVNDYPRAGGVR